MIELTNPLFHGGRIVPVGVKIELSGEFEQEIVKAGNGFYCKFVTEEPPVDPLPESPPPENPPKEDPTAGIKEPILGRAGIQGAAE